MIKALIHLEDLTIININASKNIAPKYVKQKPDRTEERNRKFNNYIWRLQYPTFTNGQNNQAEAQQGNKELE